MFNFLKKLFGFNTTETEVAYTPVIKEEPVPVVENKEKPAAKRPVKKAGAGRPKKIK